MAGVGVGFRVWGRVRAEARFGSRLHFEIVLLGTRCVSLCVLFYYIVAP